ncbi:MAG: carbamoyltransferase HypF [Solirubrobacteraceae bacterium]
MSERRRRRVRARADGTVQGVGFRPHVHRLATELGCSGWVRNDERGVLLEVEGDAQAVAALLTRLQSQAPPLAVIERVSVQELEPTGGLRFEIRPSRSAGSSHAPVTPDSATCEACLRELFDPGDRRHRYPFINCTDCGPRFTIIRAVPYDRPQTTMAAFTMCERCAAEYEDPADRRFHAQPNACPDCGPHARLTDAGGTALEPDAGLDAVAAAARCLLEGAIVAVKGLGGYHLAARADDEAAVARLRERKHREERPFALMAPDLDAAQALVELRASDRALLCSRARPIVLAPRLPGARVADSLAPGCADLGVMLPYSPLHHLLARDFAAGAAAAGAGAALVMTSGNVSDEPIAYEDADAIERLTAIADRFLTHDRPIHMRTDDSLARTTATGGEDGVLMLRRSRGYVPAAIPLAGATDHHVLGVGAELKSTFCVAKGTRAWVSHHIGDLANLETLRSFRDGVAHFERLFDVAPQIVAHDLHPDYLSTRFAQELPGVELIAVQHHHAHLAAAAAEHGVRGPVVGAILDGAGLGDDGTIWGGEILVGDLAGFERAAHLWPVSLPGGDAAAREPWRMACSWLLACAQSPQTPEQLPIPAALAREVTPERWQQVAQLARSGFQAPVTTSAGRLFDAVAALCGLRAHASYEGQAAALLESSCDPRERGAYPMSVLDAPRPGAPALLDARELVRAVDGELAAGVSPSLVAARFHNGLADTLAQACAAVAGARGLDTVVLSGGVFQNRRLLARTHERLRRDGLRVLIPRLLPPNDGGISYGQVAVAISRRPA